MKVKEATSLFGIDEVLEQDFSVEEYEPARAFLCVTVDDCSISMSEHENAMRDLKEMSKEAWSKSKDADEMLVSRIDFSDDVRIDPFTKVEEMRTDYKTDGCTSLFDAIVAAKTHLLNNGRGYYEQLCSTGTKTKVAVVIFSDGKDNKSHFTAFDAKQAVSEMRNEEIIVAFIAFGSKAFGIAQNLGIPDGDILESKDTSESALRKIIHTVSKSVISASKSAGAGNVTGFFNV